MNHLHRLLLPLACSLFLFACGGGSGAAVGSWKIDSSATVEASASAFEAPEGTPEGQADMMKGMMKTMLEGMDLSMTFTDDGKCSGTMKMSMMGQTQSDTMTGTWSVDGKAISIDSTDSKGKKEKITGTVSGDEMRLDMGEGQEQMTLVLRRT